MAALATQSRWRTAFLARTRSHAHWLGCRSISASRALLGRRSQPDSGGGVRAKPLFATSEAQGLVEGGSSARYVCCARSTAADDWPRCDPRTARVSRGPHVAAEAGCASGWRRGRSGNLFRGPGLCSLVGGRYGVPILASALMEFVSLADAVTVRHHAAEFSTWMPSQTPHRHLRMIRATTGGLRLLPLGSPRERVWGHGVNAANARGAPASRAQECGASWPSQSPSTTLSDPATYSGMFS